MVRVNTEFQATAKKQQILYWLKTGLFFFAFLNLGLHAWKDKCHYS